MLDDTVEMYHLTNYRHSMLIDISTLSFVMSITAMTIITCQHLGPLGILLQDELK